MPGSCAVNACNPAVNPLARLVQTDDLGKVFSTPTLAYQAESKTLVDGRPTIYSADSSIANTQCGLTSCGWEFHLRPSMVSRQSLSPDVIGVNHYLSSERFFDDVSAIRKAARAVTDAIGIQTCSPHVCARPARQVLKHF